jgi:hypothetical protein
MRRRGTHPLSGKKYAAMLAKISEPRFVAEGACGGEYAVVWDRKRQRIVFPYLRTGVSLSDDQIRAIAEELNGLMGDANERL